MQRTFLPPVNEAQFTNQIMQLAHILGWRSFHVRTALRADGRYRTPVQGDGAGFPDLLLIRPPRLILAELKTARGHIEPAQEVWLADFRQLPWAETFVWKPADWDSLVEVLT